MKQAISIRTVVCLSAFLSLALAMPAWASHGGGGGGGSSTGCSGTSGQSFNVTTYILGLETDAPPFQLLSDVSTSGTDKYSYIKYSRSDTVISYIAGGSCDWGMSISPSSTQRAVELNLTQPLPNQSPAPSLPSGWSPDSYGFASSPAGISTSCAANSANGSTSVGNLTGGQSIQCALNIKFISGGNQSELYFLRMNPSSYSGTTWAQADCTDPTGTSPCADWTITPGQFGAGGYASDDGIDSIGQTPTAIGELFETCSTCITETPMGLYYVDFSIKVTNP